MPNDIHSIQFYEIIAKSIADENKNGKIDTPHEQSIFDKYMKKFDVNNDNKVDESDVKEYEQSVSYSSKDRETIKALDNFMAEHPNSSSWSDTEWKKFDELISSDLISKKTSIHEFKLRVSCALKYLKAMGEDKLAESYLQSFDKFCNENKDEF